MFARTERSWCLVWFTGLRKLYADPATCWEIMLHAPMEVPGSRDMGYSGICIEEVCPVCRDEWMCA